MKKKTLEYFKKLRNDQDKDTKNNYIDGILKACLFLASEKQDFNANTLMSLVSGLSEAPLIETQKIMLLWAGYMKKEKFVTIRNPVFPLFVWI